MWKRLIEAHLVSASGCACTFHASSAPPTTKSLASAAAAAARTTEAQRRSAALDAIAGDELKLATRHETGEEAAMSPQRELEKEEKQKADLCPGGGVGAFK